MKAPAFDYIKARSLDHVFTLLAEHGDEARLLAGGQTLLATLNMRLSEPALLIDINGLENLAGITLQADCLRIGALARHHDIEVSELVARHAPLLSLAAPHVAHRAIRNLGTLGGSLAFADPAAEWPCCAVALDATLVLQSQRGERRVPAGDFFLDLYNTDLRDDELISACEFPLPTAGQRVVFDELARRHGDYAIVGLAIRATLVDTVVHDVRLVFLGTGNIPMRARAAEQALEGRTPDAATIAQAQAQLADELRAQADIYHSATTKLQLACVLLRRLLARLAQPA